MATIKKLSDHTERELLEKIVWYSKTTADNTGFMKMVLIVSIVLALIGIFLK